MGWLSSFIDNTMGGITDATGKIGDVLGGAVENLTGTVDWAVQHPLEAAALASVGYTYYPEIGAWLDSTGGYVSPTTEGALASAGVDSAALSSASPVLDYSMPSATTGGLGLQGTAALDGTLSSGLAAPASGSLGGGLGLTASEAANLAAMGGGQGLLANAAGGGILGETGVNTGLLTANNLYNADVPYVGSPTVTPDTTPAPAVTDTKALTPAQIANIAKAGVTAAGLLGGAKAVGNLVGGGTTGNISLPAQNRAGISSGSAQYSPEYYQAIQAKYNQLLPQQPRDVTTELKNWYETKYTPNKVA